MIIIKGIAVRWPHKGKKAGTLLVMLVDWGSRSGAQNWTAPLAPLAWSPAWQLLNLAAPLDPSLILGSQILQLQDLEKEGNKEDKRSP